MLWLSAVVTSPGLHPQGFGSVRSELEHLIQYKFDFLHRVSIQTNHSSFYYLIVLDQMNLRRLASQSVVAIATRMAIGESGKAIIRGALADKEQFFIPAKFRA